MMISQLDYDDFVGRLAWGRIRSGTVSVGDKLQLMSEEQTSPFKVSSLFEFQGSNRVATKTLSAGDIAVLSGFESDIIIGDTIAGTEVQEALPALRVDEPTVGVFLSINTSPFAGLEGDYVTSRKLKERLEKELLHNVAVKVEETDSPEIWKVLGRGELQLALLAETMRREGYEFMMSQPQVVIKKTDAGMVEPYLTVQVDVDETHMGIVTEKLGKRKAQLRAVEAKGSGRVQAVFFMPSRGLIGYRSQFLTDTRGTGLLNTQFDSFQPHAGPIHQRNNGPLVSDRQGVATPYSLFNLEDRGRMFIRSGTKVYKGMIIGEYNRSGELNVNITKEKKLTNMRASGSDENVKLSPVQDWTIEKALEWISDEEKIEITPKNIRLCKKQL